MKLILKVDDKKAAALIEWLHKFEFVRIISSQSSEDTMLSIEEQKIIDLRVDLYSASDQQLFDWNSVKSEIDKN